MWINFFVVYFTGLSDSLTVRLKGVGARMTEREVCASSGSTTPVFANKFCNKPRQSGFEVRTLRIKYQTSSANHTCAVTINLLKPTSYFMYHQVWHLKISHGDYIAFKCFVWISEQTVSFALYIMNRLVFITDVECLLRCTHWVLT